MRTSAKTIDKAIALLEKGKSAKTKTARVNAIRDAQIKVALALKQAKGPDPEDPPQ
jgi:hypothetical protein